MPTRQALVDGVIKADNTVLDYGSGKGHDVARLQEIGVSARGWDPFFNPEEQPTHSDVVSLIYVLNVIEDPAERERTLANAWSYATQALVVSTRLTWERSQLNGDSSADGIVSSRQTFQHLFSPSELRDLIARVTGQKPVSPSPGVVYAFRDDHARMAYLASRATAAADWLTSSDSTTALAAIADFTERRGRAPQLEEVPDSVLHLLQKMTTKEINRFALEAAGTDRVAAGARRSTLDVLLLLGIEVFNGRGPKGDLPLSIQADIQAFFPSYKDACRRADRLLFKLRDDTYLRSVMKNSAGKMTPTSLYVHRRAVTRMPVLLRLYENCGAVAVGRPPDWDLIKLGHSGRAVAWLGYPDFDEDPHPRLAWSYSVDMRSLEGSYTSYAERANRPLLHRKHEFLAADDPDVPKYKKLTDAEVRAGLYANPHLIGHETGWQEALDSNGVQLRGHRVVRPR